MAKINNVKLLVESGPTISTFKVTVSFKLNFNQSDSGKKFRYSIRLRPASSGNPLDEDPSPAVLYTYKFGNKTTKTVSGGPFVLVDPISETRTIPKEILNEDPDSHPIKKGIVNHMDEFFASVFLMTGSSGVGLFVDEKHSDVMTMLLD